MSETYLGVVAVIEADDEIHLLTVSRRHCGNNQLFADIEPVTPGREADIEFAVVTERQVPHDQPLFRVFRVLKGDCLANHSSRKWLRGSGLTIYWPEPFE